MDPYSNHFFLLLWLSTAADLRLNGWWRLVYVNMTGLYVYLSCCTLVIYFYSACNSVTNLSQTHTVVYDWVISHLYSIRAFDDLCCQVSFHFPFISLKVEKQQKLKQVEIYIKIFYYIHCTHICTHHCTGRFKGQYKNNIIVKLVLFLCLCSVINTALSSRWWCQTDTDSLLTVEETVYLMFQCL